MKILVCISHVPDTTSKINFEQDNTKFDENGVQYVINPNDEFGLTKAMFLKDSDGASVDVVHVGNYGEATLRKALAIGADKAYRIDAEAVDGFVVASEISKFIKKENYDLVICGRESIDFNGGAVAGMIAEILGYTFINKCIGLVKNEGQIIVKREVDGGTETIRTNLPLVIAGQKGLVEESELKIPNMRGIMMARKKPFEVIESSGVEARSKSVVFEKPSVKTQVKLVPDNDVAYLVELLRNEAKVI